MLVDVGWVALLEKRRRSGSFSAYMLNMSVPVSRVLLPKTCDFVVVKVTFRSLDDGCESISDLFVPGVSTKFPEEGSLFLQ